MQCMSFFKLYFQEFHHLQDENIQLKTICEDQERALEELGSKLSEYVHKYTLCIMMKLRLQTVYEDGGEALCPV